MEKIKISGSEKMYEICSIMPVSKTVTKIVFPAGEDIPEIWDGDILLHTAGGIHCSTLYGYNTVYQQERQTVYLSNDGSVYVPPEPVPEPEPYIPTLDEVKAAKKAEISAVCEQVIYSGINVTLSDGESHHFSLAIRDQINLFGKQAQLAAGAEKIEYHSDGHPCHYYSREDVGNIIEAATWYVSYHTTYCNALNMWIAGCESVEEVEQVFYGADVPEEYRNEVLNAYLIQIAGMATKGGENEETV